MVSCRFECRNRPMPSLRLIPSIDALVTRPLLAGASATHGRDSVTAAARQAADELRAEIKNRGAHAPASEDDAAGWIERRTIEILAARLAPSLRPVINATGVIVHTNLGRAPLATEAISRASRIAAGYSNLEYDLTLGDRGHRHVHAERLFRDLTGAEIWAPELGRRWMEHVEHDRTVRQNLSFGRWPQNLNPRPCSPDRVFADGDRIRLGEHTVHAIGVQGHTKDSTCFVWEDRGRRALFTGDGGQK